MNYPAAELRGIKKNSHYPDAGHRGILLVKF